MILTQHQYLKLPMCSFSWESVQICEPLFLEDLWRSYHCYVRTTADLQGSLQMFKDFSYRFFRKIFTGASGKQCIAFLGFFNKYFCRPRISQLKLSITQNSWAGKLVPIPVILVSGEYLALVLHGNLSVSLELSRSGRSALRGSFAILTFIWCMKLDTWPLSGLVEVLIKWRGCNVSGTWFDGVVLVIAGNLEYLIVIHWSFSYA